MDKIVQVVTTLNDETANKFLNHGWKLLYVTTSAETDDRYLNSGAFQNSEPCFVLGATKEVAEKYSRTDGLNRYYR